MKLSIRGTTIDRPASVREEAESRIRDTLSRLGNRIRHVTVEFTEVNGDAARCVIRVETHDGQVTVVEDTKRCGFAALDRGLDTLRRLLRQAKAGSSGLREVWR